MFSNIFRSRWAALFWAVGVVWTANDVAGAAPATPTAKATQVDATGEAVDPTDLAALASASP